LKRLPATEIRAWAVWDLAGRRWICERIKVTDVSCAQRLRALEADLVRPAWPAKLTAPATIVRVHLGFCELWGLEAQLPRTMRPAPRFVKAMPDTPSSPDSISLRQVAVET
jgi:hypothetical protein